MKVTRVVCVTHLPGSRGTVSHPTLCRKSTPREIRPGLCVIECPLEGTQKITHVFCTDVKGT